MPARRGVKDHTREAKVLTVMFYDNLITSGNSEAMCAVCNTDYVKLLSLSCPLHSFPKEVSSHIHTPIDCKLLL